MDDTETIIDGGNIITGSVSANTINANSGTFNAANIPNLDAGKITSGYISADRINAGSIGVNKIDASSGTFNTANIPELSAGKITSGDIAADRIKANAVSAINATANKIDAKNINVSAINIGDLAGEIGGRNLVIGSSNWTCMENTTGLTINGEECSLTTNNTNNRTHYINVNTKDVITVSVDVKVSTAATYTKTTNMFFLVDEFNTSNSRVTYEVSPTVNLTTSYQRVSITFTITNSNVAKILFGFRNTGSGGTITMKHLKIEKGSKPTD